MNTANILPLLIAACIAATLPSCSVVERSSQHAFSSGTYRMLTPGNKAEKVYVAVTEDALSAHRITGLQAEQTPLLRIPLATSDSLCHYPVKFQKTSLDIDLSTVLLKIRPASADIPVQAVTDFNAALYAGWRHDTYRVRGKMDPLGNCNYAVSSRGYDVGLFIGPGVTGIDPLTTRQASEREYSALILQTGLAGFLESSFASFGLAVGTDFLMGPDRQHWIYQRKPWFGFMVGIALN